MKTITYLCNTYYTRMKISDIKRGILNYRIKRGWSLYNIIYKYGKEDRLKVVEKQLTSK